jgi:periplasmic nitrate reductase NapD
MNISSVIVSAQPGRACVVNSALMQASDVEIHATTDDGRFVVTIETDTDGETVSAFDRINAMDGVMSVALVFHQFESDPERQD